MQLLKGRAGDGGSSDGDGGGKHAGADGNDGAAGGAGRDGGAKANADGGSESQATASTAADGGIVSDYGRGRRLRKLMRLLSSKAALQTVVGFRFKVIVLAAAIMAMHMGAFAALMGLMGKQDTYMTEVAAAGEVLDVMHRVTSLSLVLEAAQRGYGGFAAADIPKYAAEMEVDLNR
jgi:hypothetical protein